MQNYVYILECKDGTLYTGWTNHLEKRIEAHNLGKGAKYTKGRGPVKLVYSAAGVCHQADEQEREGGADYATATKKYINTR